MWNRHRLDRCICYSSTATIACIFIFVCIPLSNKGVQVTNLHHPSHHQIQYQHMVQVIVFSCIIVEHVPQLVLLKIHYDAEKECRETHAVGTYSMSSGLSIGRPIEVHNNN